MQTAVICSRLRDAFCKTAITILRFVFDSTTTKNEHVYFSSSREAS